MKTPVIVSIQWLMLALTVWVMGACQKDEVRAVVQPGAAPTLTASTSSPVLQSTSATQNAVTFSWNAVDYGYPAAVTYTLQFDKKGSNFAAPVAFANASALARTFTVADFNTLLINLGIAPGSSGQIEARVKSDVSPGVASVLSAASTVTATPYSVAIVYPTLYAPGDYQNWTPDKAATIVSVKSDKVYEGYVNFTNASTLFKLTDAPNWNAGIYGNKTGANGTIASPGDNMFATGAGYYLLKANLNANTWSVTKTTWAAIGSATPKGWDADTPLTYNATTGTWSGSIALVKGDLKFRANSAWDLNYGDTKADAILDLNGDNIAVPADGTYTVTLDLSKPGQYTYSIRK